MQEMSGQFQEELCLMEGLDIRKYPLTNTKQHAPIKSLMPRQKSTINSDKQCQQKHLQYNFLVSILCSNTI